jgi:hypothetical protein
MDGWVSHGWGPTLFHFKGWHTSCFTALLDVYHDLPALILTKSDIGHTHPQSDVVSLVSDLAARAALVHTHAQSDVVNLVSALAGKAASVHTHTQADVTNLVSALTGKASSVHTHAESDVTNLVSDLAGKALSVHTHTESDVTNLVSDLAGKAASVHTHIGIPTLFRVTADVAQSSNVTFTNLFTQAVLANEVWAFDIIVYYLSAAVTTGIVLQVDSPASPAASQISMVTYETAILPRNLTAAQGVALVGTAGLTTVLETRISGLIEVGAGGGNIVAKFRSEVNASAITVKRGSWGRFYKF